MGKTRKAFAIFWVAFLLLSGCSKKTEQQHTGSHTVADSVRAGTQIGDDDNQSPNIHASPPGAPLGVEYKEWPDSLSPRADGLPRYIEWNYFSKTSRRGFTAAELDVLAREGFFLKEIQPSADISTDDMVDLYSDMFVSGFGQSYSTVPVFITSDFLLHVFHVVFDRMLQDVEEKKLFPTLTRLTSALLHESIEAMNSAAPPAIHDAMEGNVAFFTVAAKLLGDTSGIPALQQPVVDREITLIMAAAGFGNSVLFRSSEDYSQYKPRGHYTVNENLSRYFRAMMWYGRRSFSTNSDRLSLQAILISQLLSQPANQALWDHINKPVEFVAGASDDLTFRNYADLVSTTFGAHPTFADFADKQKLRQFMDAATATASPRISGNALKDRKDPNSIERGFRFMGQRMVPDAVIFNNLTSPRVGTDLSPRNIPSVTDVMAILGSPVAGDINKKFAGIPGYDLALQRLKSEFDGYDESRWTSNLYWCWMNALRPLVREKGNTHPPFMRGRKWAGKGLLTASGSWSELKHDTILFSKQSYAESGEGEDEEPPKPPPQPKSYVEADMDFFNRLVYMTERTRAEFSSLGLLTDEYTQKLTKFDSGLHTLRQIVRKELENLAISHAEYDLMLTFASEVSSIILPWDRGDIIEQKHKQMASVSDVHTDAIGEQVLEEGVGVPQQIFIVVKDSSGGLRVCVGYTYTHFEFVQPMNKRMTDEEWKTMVYPRLTPLARASEAPWSRTLRIQGQ